MNSLDKWKLIFGFSMLVMLAAIATVIALGRVEQETSYGLDQIIIALATLSGGFAQWAFRTEGQKKDDK